jgi:hypothetical protein
MARKKRRTKSTANNGLWNVLTIIVLLCMVVVIAFVTLTYTNPYNQFNPYPPPTEAVAIVLPTEVLPPTGTPTPASLPPTWTPTPSISPIPSETPLPSATAALATPLGEESLQTATSTPKVDSKYPFVLRTDPVGIDASILYPSRGCRWSGVGGQVVDMQDSPYIGITVQLGGTLEGLYTNEYSLTGTATKYGEAGFEFTLTDYPFDSDSELWVRLIDQSNYPLSEKVFFDTFADCGQNLIIINFEQVR